MAVHALPSMLCCPPVPPAVCDVFLDDSKESVLDLSQAQLETVVPAAEGTPVLVLAGPARGMQGRLLKRNTGEGP